MKKYLIPVLSLVLLSGCGQEAQEAAAATTAAAATPGITVRKSLGRRVINAGYKKVTETVYENLSEEDPDLEELTPDAQTTVSFNYDAQRTSQQVYAKEDDELVLTLSEEYKYDGDAVSEVDTLDEDGTVTTVSTLTDGTWTDTDADGNALSTSSQRDSYGNIISLTDEDGNTLQRTYDENGWLLTEKKIDPQGTEISNTTWTRYSNDELADEIITQTAAGTTDRLLNRGTRNDDTRISYYTDVSGKKYTRIEETYGESMVMRKTEEDLTSETYTITVYTYE